MFAGRTETNTRGTAGNGKVHSAKQVIFTEISLENEEKRARA